MKVADFKTLHFKISSGLKRIIGQDLITNDVVAIFELVKNSFDAHAQNVHLVFGDDCIYVIDDGKGMTESAVLEKWLFVAYSAKREGTEDQDYRGSHFGAFAGNKGVGRFSCDRLGSFLEIQTKIRRRSVVNVLEVDWDKFERNDRTDFTKIPVQFRTAPKMAVPISIEPLQSGTILKISGLRDEWTRSKLLEIKRHLAKLINPFDPGNGSFSILMHAAREEGEDERRLELLRRKYQEPEAQFSHEIVNGPVENFIFDEISKRSALLEVSFSPAGNEIISRLIDRDELIYEIAEPNDYPILNPSSFSCKLYYLNHSAKTMFARRMGIPSVAFGSVFLFKNGFRVFPIGEEGDDTFQIDRRKQQGYARYLGTRDIVGRIDVKGDESLFRESSSRDRGLIETPAYRGLVECFWEKCFKRLESYVVGVTWKDSLDKFRMDGSGLHSAPSRARIIDLVSDLATSHKVRIINYNKNLVGILSDKVEQFEGSLRDLRELARATGDTNLLRRVQRAEERYKELKRAEQEARRVAEEERLARQRAELAAQKAEEDKRKAEIAAEIAKAELEEERKRTLFLTSVTSLDVDTITNLHHQVIICSADIHQLIESQIEKLKASQGVDKQALFGFLEQMRLKNQQVLAIARIATRANFRLDSDEINDDVVSYCRQYLENISRMYERIDIRVRNGDQRFIRSFKPIEMAIVIDNLISNARKADSPVMEVSFEVKGKILSILFKDEGRGLDQSIRDPAKIFEKGVSTTDGSGLGLYHVRQIVESMGGAIEYRKPAIGGAEFLVVFPRT